MDLAKGFATECGILELTVAMFNFVRLRFPAACFLATFILMCAAFAQRPFREYLCWARPVVR